MCRGVRACIARIGPQVAGRVASVPVSPDQTVAKGTLLVTLDSVDVGRARGLIGGKITSVRAESELAREERLVDAGASSELAARAMLDLSRLSLNTVGDRLHTLGATGGNGGASGISLVSPIAGRVLEVKARLGQPVGPTDTLIVVGETSQVWLAVDISERDVSRLHFGDEAERSPRSRPANRTSRRTH